MVSESENWWSDSMPAAYEQYLVPALFRPYAADLVGRIKQMQPARILELAAGTGVVTREMAAASVEASVTATDVNPVMIAEGSLHAPGAKWQQADATTLPFDDDTFDVVVCQFGAMFFPDRPTAYGEARRVLSEGGTFLFNTWGPVAANGFTAALLESVDEILGPNSGSFITEVPFGYYDEDRIRADLSAGGFEKVSIERLELISTCPSAEDLARGYALGTPVRMDLEGAGDLDSMTARLAASLEQRFGSGSITAPMLALVVTASV